MKTPLHIPHDIDGSSQTLDRKKPVPKVGQKVIVDGKYGVITKVLEPNTEEGFTGRFFVDVEERYYVREEEFYFSDYGTKVVPVQPLK